MLSKVVLNLCTFTQWFASMVYFCQLEGIDECSLCEWFGHASLHVQEKCNVWHIRPIEVDPYFKSTFPTKQNNMLHLTIISMLGLVHLSLRSHFINAIALELKTIHVIKLQRMYFVCMGLHLLFVPLSLKKNFHINKYFWYHDGFSKDFIHDF